MNGRSQMQGGENLILPKEKNANPVLLSLSFAGKTGKTTFVLYGTEWKERGYGLRLEP